jgi:hypothetical protein
MIIQTECLCFSNVNVCVLEAIGVSDQFIRESHDEGMVVLMLQTLAKGLRESAESHEAILEQQRVDFGTFVREHQDDIENHCSYIGGWSQTIVAGLQQCSHNLDKFLNEELQKDIPTGNM